MNSTIGMLNMSMGRIQLLILNPELNQMTISESLYQRDKVRSMARNKLRDNSIGKNLIKLKPSIVVIESLGKTPFAASWIK